MSEHRHYKVQSTKVRPRDFHTEAQEPVLEQRHEISALLCSPHHLPSCHLHTHNLDKYIHNMHALPWISQQRVSIRLLHEIHGTRLDRHSQSSQYLQWARTRHETMIWAIHGMHTQTLTCTFVDTAT